jgi:tetratricopeptide (TPR) repeat protein
MGQRKAFRKVVKEPDEFIGASEKALDYVRSNPTQVWTAVAGVVAVLLLILGVSLFMDFRQEAVMKASGKAMLAYEEAMRDPAGYQKAAGELEKVFSDRPGTIEGQTSLFFAAALHFANGNPAKAGELYAKVAAASAGTPTLSRLAARNAAYVKEAQGDASGAEKLLQGEVAAANGLPKQEALIELARLAAKRGDKAKADEYYRQLLEESPEGTYGDVARKKLGMPARKAKLS